MIGFIAPRAEEALALADALEGRAQRVDGPFRVWVGDGPGSEPWEVWHAPGGADGAYAATTLAVKRGAKLLVHLGLARAAPAFALESGVEPGDLLPVGRILDGRNLAPLQRLLPDLAERLPLAFPAAPASPAREALAARDEAAPRAATLAEPLTCPFLADEIHRRWGAGLFDEAASGAADAAAELDAPLLAMLVCAGEAAPARACPRGPWWLAEGLRRRAVRRLLDELSKDLGR